jgi:hypothetical protein
MKELELRAHWSILIDVAGASSNNDLKGLQVHMIVEEMSTSRVGLLTGYAILTQQTLAEKFLSFKCIGKIDNIFHPNKPLLGLEAWSVMLVCILKTFEIQMVKLVLQS